MKSQALSFVSFPTKSEIAAIVCAFLPFVVSMRSVSYSTVNGQITSFSYLDPLAIVLGAVALFLTFSNYRLVSQTHPDSKTVRIAALVVVLLVGGYQAARGFGMFIDSQTYVQSTANNQPLSPTMEAPATSAPTDAPDIVSPLNSNQILYLAPGRSDSSVLTAIHFEQGSSPMPIISSWEILSGQSALSSPAAPIRSPDGSQIVYRRNDTSKEGLWIATLYGTDARQLTNGRDDQQPAWSPDGTRIAFIRRDSKTGDENVFVIDIANREITPVTTDDALYTDPAWSPDSTRITFTGTRGGINNMQRGIWIRDVHGSNDVTVIEAEQISRDGFELKNLDWSPDGKKLAFIASQGLKKTMEIWTVNVDGSDLVNLTPGLDMTYQPAWSPDSTRLAFVHCDVWPDCGLYLMNADGTTQTRLTDAFAGVNSGTEW